MEPFDWIPLGPSSWFADPAEPIDHPLYVVLAATLAVAVIGGIIVRLLASGMFDGHRLKQRLAMRMASCISWIAAIGLVILLLRWQPVPLLSKPIWWYLWVLTAVGLVGYAGYYYRRRYPQRRLAYEESARRKRYLPRHSASAGRQRQRQRRAR